MKGQGDQGGRCGGGDAPSPNLPKLIALGVAVGFVFFLILQADIKTGLTVAAAAALVWLGVWRA